MTICVYGASSNDIDKTYIEKTEALGALMAKRGHSLVFGGGAQGLMGASARGVKSAGGRVIGIAPRFFNVDGVLYDNCDEFIYTDTMRERKQLMEDKSDAFIMSPGGIGTYEEFFEILTLKQLGRHNKPIVIFNINGYYNPMLDMLKVTAEEGFMKEKCLELFKVFEDETEVLDYIEKYNEESLDVTHLKNI